MILLKKTTCFLHFSYIRTTSQEPRLILARKKSMKALAEIFLLMPVKDHGMRVTRALFLIRQKQI
jgi:hypothetical protein